MMIVLTPRRSALKKPLNQLKKTDNWSECLEGKKSEEEDYSFFSKSKLPSGASK